MEYNKQKYERVDDLYKDKEQDSPYVNGEKQSSNIVFDGSINNVFNGPVNSVKQTFKQMEKERKIALGVLSLFSLLVIVIFFVNLRSNIKKPFVINIPETENSSNQSNCADGNCSATGDNLSSENMDLKLVDTDGDTISDWDELFVHGTSPYLEDTDGDNLNDYEEIFAYKTDPTCPQGQNCSSSVSSSQSTESTVDQNGLLESLSNGANTNNQGQALNSESISQLYNISPADLRSQLIEAGFSKDEIDLIGDEELLDIYRQSLYQSMGASQ